MIDGMARMGMRDRGSGIIGPTRLRLRCDGCHAVVGYIMPDGTDVLEGMAGYVPQKLSTALTDDGAAINGFICGEHGCETSRPVAVACCDACENMILRDARLPWNTDYAPDDWGPDVRDTDFGWTP